MELNDLNFSVIINSMGASKQLSILLSVKCVYYYRTYFFSFTINGNVGLKCSVSLN